MLRTGKPFFISFCDAGPEIEERVERRVMSIIALKWRDIDVYYISIANNPTNNILMITDCKAVNKLRENLTMCTSIISDSWLVFMKLTPKEEKGANIPELLFSQNVINLFYKRNCAKLKGLSYIISGQNANVVQGGAAHHCRKCRYHYSAFNSTKNSQTVPREHYRLLIVTLPDLRLETYTLIYGQLST